MAFPAKIYKNAMTIALKGPEINTNTARAATWREHGLSRRKSGGKKYTRKNHNNNPNANLNPNENLNPN